MTLNNTIVLLSLCILHLFICIIIRKCLHLVTMSFSTIFPFIKGFLVNSPLGVILHHVAFPLPWGFPLYPPSSKWPYLKSPGWQPTLCAAWCPICWFALACKKYGHTWHRMSFLRPGVIKQHKPNQTSLVSQYHQLYLCMISLQEHLLALL